VLLSKRITVLPTDEVLFADAVAPEFSLLGQLKVELDPASTSMVYGGDRALAVQADGFWRLIFTLANSLDLFGYRSLQFAFHPGDMAAV
jgi:hypothetical protein